MVVLKILDILCIIALIVFGIDTFAKVKRFGDKTVEEVRKPLLTRVNVIMVLTTAVALFTILIVLFGARQ